jgi:hypothetical protein
MRCDKRTMPFAADAITFPVAKAITLVNSIRTFADRTLIRYLATLIIAAVFLSPFAMALPQKRVIFATVSFIPFYPTIYS